MLGSRMIDLLVALVSMFVAPADVDALRSTAPAYLTMNSAREHLAASIVAGAITRTEPAALLSIAHHESRYTSSVVTPEPGGRYSCGVMTPEPLTSRLACSEATQSIASGYLAGARHLRAWLDACARRGEGRGCALRGYAGAARRDCRAEPSLRSCVAASDFAARAALIVRAMRRYQGGAT